MKVKEEPQQHVKQELAMPSVVVKAEPPDDAKAVFVVDIPTMQCTMHRGGEHLTAPLEKGPMQLLVAKFGDIVHTTELCNLMLFAAPAPKLRRNRLQQMSPKSQQLLLKWVRLMQQSLQMLLQMLLKML